MINRLFSKARRSKPETRNYTSLLTGAFEAAASGGTEAAPLQTAAVEFAVGLYSRALSCAEVEGPDAITPSFLATTARSMLRSGEAYFLIDTDNGTIRLHPATHGDVKGPFDEELWTYQLSLTGPSTAQTATYPSAQVLHFRYAVDPLRPWDGIAPWRYAGVSGSALAAIDRVVEGRASAPYGSMIGLPENPQPGDGSDPMQAYHANMQRAKGKALLYEYSGSWQHGTGPSRMESWDFGVGFDSATNARNIIALDIVSAFGVPSALLVPNADGTARRESYRQFLHTSLAPLAKTIESELSRKLETRVHLDLSPIAAADVAGRARAFKALIDAGMEATSATRLVGLDDA